MEGRPRIDKDIPYPHLSTPNKKGPWEDEALVIPTLTFAGHRLSQILAHKSRCYDSSIYTRKDSVFNAHRQKEEERKNAQKPNYPSTPPTSFAPDTRFLRGYGRHHLTFLLGGIANGIS